MLTLSSMDGHPGGYVLTQGCVTSCRPFLRDQGLGRAPSMRREGKYLTFHRARHLTPLLYATPRAMQKGYGSHRRGPDKSPLQALACTHREPEAQGGQMARWPMACSRVLTCSITVTFGFQSQRVPLHLFTIFRHENSKRQKLLGPR